MGGHIGLETLEGRGSTFWFTAVLQKQTSTPVVPSREYENDANSAPPPIHILLVEDDRANQVAFSRLLSKTNHQVDIAENGRESLKLLEEKNYDVVLMDCRMPLMDGYEAAAIRNPDSNVRNHAIPIIALTAHAFREDRQRCLDAGMNDYLSKPVDFELLQDLLNKWVRPQ